MATEPKNNALGVHRQIVSDALNKLEESTRRAKNSATNLRFIAIYDDDLAAITAARKELLA